jgi:thioesterase domain-containing protein
MNDLVQKAAPKRPHSDHANLTPNRTSQSCLVQLRSGSGLPLFLIHGVDGEVARFSALADHLADRSVYGIRSQALVNGAPASMRLQEQAAFYLQEIRTVQPRGPYHLLGFSYGGLVALEIAQQLDAQGQKCAFLGAVDNMLMGGSTAPAASAGSPLPGEPRGSVSGPGRRRTAHLPKVLGPGGFAYARRKLSGRLLRLTYTVLDRMRQPVPDFLRRPYHINWFAAVHYVPRSYSGRAALFRTAASRDDHRRSDEMWARIARDGIEIRDIPGTHETLFFEPNVSCLAEQIEASLARLD